MTIQDPILSDPPSDDKLAQRLMIAVDEPYGLSLEEYYAGETHLCGRARERGTCRERPPRPLAEL